MNVPGYEGNPDNPPAPWRAAGSAQGTESRSKELDADQARQLLEAVQREQLASHEGRKSPKGSAGGQDW